MVSLKFRFLGDIRELSDSAQANTAWSQKNKFSEFCSIDFVVLASHCL